MDRFLMCGGIVAACLSLFAPAAVGDDYVPLTYPDQESRVASRAALEQGANPATGLQPRQVGYEYDVDGNPSSDSGQPAVDNSDGSLDAAAVSSAETSHLDVNNGAGCCPPKEKEDECCKKKKAAVKKAVAGAYKGVFYDNDFSYLDNPLYNDYHLGEEFKQLHVGNMLTFSAGGQLRVRQHHERNMRGTSLNPLDDDFLLYRTRLFLNADVADAFRVSAEFLDAVSNYEDFAPRPIEENRADMLNLFGDVKLLDTGDGKVWARYGRQELLYGDQRTVSPLDWGNTRRNFEGAKLLSRGANWDVDMFYTHPIPVNKVRFDSPDQSQEFLGAYAAYKGIENGGLDLYYLRLAEYHNQNANPGNADFYYNTLGARLKGQSGSLLWDLEGAYQFGEFGAYDHSAGFFVLGGGYVCECHCWKPTIWMYYDWASGDDVIGNGYHHLFPLSHQYMGWMDLFGRRNLEDFNIQLSVQPTKKVKLIAWWHMFNLQDGGDVPYNVVMQPQYGGVRGRSQYLGQEIDLAAQIAITERTGLLFGYSHFFAGTFYQTHPSGLEQADADFIYTQIHQNF